MESFSSLVWSNELDNLLEEPDIESAIEILRDQLQRSCWQEAWDEILRALGGPPNAESCLGTLRDVDAVESESSFSEASSRSLSDSSSDTISEPKGESSTVIWQRHQDNIRLEHRLGLPAFRRALKVHKAMTDRQREIMEKCFLLLDGEDVFWDGNVEVPRRHSGEAFASIAASMTRRNSSTLQPQRQSLRKVLMQGATKSPQYLICPHQTSLNNSETKFGRLRVTFFPFSAALKFDDCNSFTVGIITLLFSPTYSSKTKVMHRCLQWILNSLFQRHLLLEKLNITRSTEIRSKGPVISSICSSSTRRMRWCLLGEEPGHRCDILMARLYKQKVEEVALW